jgi:SSS family solute:Na+ symporter
MRLEQWAVDGRGFGAVFVFLLMAGEIYTTLTFRGAGGYAYGHGGPACYILGYACLVYIISYWMLPPMWRYAREHRLISQPDYIAARYHGWPLGLLVAVVGMWR